MKLKRKCSHCNQIKLIHIDKNPPICEECLVKIKHNKEYLIKLIILIIIIILVFRLSIFIS